jgi:putative transposase
MIASSVTELAPIVGTRAACAALAVARATHYRRRRGPRLGPPAPRPSPVRALSEAERAAVLELLHAERFVDASPGAVVATLLDEGTYLASERTLYRILADAGEVRERRNVLHHPAYARPELLATGPNELWSWDISKLRGPAKWTYFQLYVILDVFSRYVAGWMVATRESATLAERLIADTVAKQGIAPGTLTVHADRGSSMTSRPVALLLADLGITKSHSRPHTSNDNPCSEAGFKTLRYRPEFAARFGSIEDARVFCQRFFRWYNGEHRHSGIAMYTPADVHYGRTRGGPGRRPRGRLRRPPRTLRQGTAVPQARPHRGLDQPPREGGAASLNPPPGCLNRFDRFRSRLRSARSSRRVGAAPSPPRSTQAGRSTLLCGLGVARCHEYGIELPMAEPPIESCLACGSVRRDGIAFAEVATATLNGSGATCVAKEPDPVY